jgi:1-acyl-sn-glycerol-3-phosphate acyltransferase
MSIGRHAATAGDRPVVQRLLSPLLWLAQLLMLVVLGLISVGWNLAAFVLYPLLPRAVGRRIGRQAIAAGYGWYWRFALLTGMLELHADALDALRDEPGLIVVANHPSMLDALMLVARLPKSACVMKASLVRNPLLGPGARLARYIRNDTPRGLIRLAVQDLKEGGQLVLFPEGTRTTRWPVNGFRPGFTLISKLSGAPIQTVFIETESPYLGKGWPLWKLPPLPIRFDVRLGKRFEPPDNPHAAQREIEAYFAAGVRRWPGRG